MFGQFFLSTNPAIKKRTSDVILICSLSYIILYKRVDLLESSFLELRCKEVINVVDGRKLGHILDVVFELQSGRICGFVVPGNNNFWNVFSKNTEIFIPYSQICKIGEDSILVELYLPPDQNSSVASYMKEKNKNPKT